MSKQPSAPTKEAHSPKSMPAKLQPTQGWSYSALINLGIWFTLNVLVAILNKTAFSGFAYPFTLSMMHMVISGIMSWIFIHVLRIVPAEKISSEVKSLINKFSLLFTVNIALGNLGLKIVNVALSSVVRSTAPAFSMIIAYFILGERTTVLEMIAVIPIIVGAALTCWGDVEFTLVALVILLVGIILACLKGSMTTKYLKDHKMHPVTMLLLLAPISSAQMFALAFFNGEIHSIAANINQIISSGAWITVLATSFLAFFLNYFNFVASKAVPQMTMTIAGNMKQVTTVALSVVLFNTELNIINTSGILLSFAGLAAYTYTQYYISQQKANKAAKLTTTTKPTAAKPTTTATKPTAATTAPKKANKGIKVE